MGRSSPYKLDTLYMSSGEALVQSWTFWITVLQAVAAVVATFSTAYPQVDTLLLPAWTSFCASTRPGQSYPSPRNRPGLPPICPLKPRQGLLWY